MAESRHTLVTLILLVVVLTLFSAALATSIALWAGDWQRHAGGMTLSLKIMWGLWALVAVATLLTHITMFGWLYRRGPREWPGAIYRTVKEGAEPPEWFKSGPTSFTITVVFVSLFGAACLATVLLWIIGNWREDREPLLLTVKIIWGAWWVLAIATVLVRVALFARQRRKQREEAARLEAEKAEQSPSGNGLGQQDVAAESPARQGETAGPPESPGYQS